MKVEMLFPVIIHDDNLKKLVFVDASLQNCYEQDIFDAASFGYDQHSIEVKDSPRKDEVLKQLRESATNVGTSVALAKEQAEQLDTAKAHLVKQKAN